MRDESSCPIISRKLLLKQLTREERENKVPRPCHLFPTHFSEESFLVRLERRGIVYLGRFQRRLQCLLRNAERLTAEHGGEDSTVGRLVAPDAARWKRLLSIVEGVIAKRTLTPARRDARPKRIQRLLKVG
jgi:hypothetical protein